MLFSVALCFGFDVKKNVQRKQTNTVVVTGNISDIMNEYE